jgi:integrase
MAKRDLTDAFIRGVRVDVRTDYVDARTVGLCLRVTANGKKTFSIRSRDAAGKVQRVTLGDYPGLTLKEAREIAAGERRVIRGSVDSVTKARKNVRNSTDDLPTLSELIDEYQCFAQDKVKIWRGRSETAVPEAQNRIRTVFAGLFEKRANTITLSDFAEVMATYVPLSGKAEANGQVSRARSYLMPVLDWASHRGKFRKLGRGRPSKLSLVDLHETHDLAADDPKITGSRDRVLSHEELHRILPLLVWPAPTCLAMRARPDLDFRPIALRFMLLTLARREEVADMLWRDFDPVAGLWNKSYVKTVRGPAKRQTLQLSQAAISLLKSLPHFVDKVPDGYVFPNVEGGKLDNWSRIARAIERESGTTGWHRHDLRRTGATLLQILGETDRVISRIMGQKADVKGEAVSKALEHYLVDSQITKLRPDPQRRALDQLAEILDQMERRKPSG